MRAESGGRRPERAESGRPQGGCVLTRLACEGAGSKIRLTNSSNQRREKRMADNGQATGTFRVKSGMAQMLKGGVIMDVVNAEQARIAEEAGAVAVMALERVPADIRAQGGVARMSDPEKVVEIQDAVTIPVMAKARIGHFVEAQVLEALEVDYIDESEVLTPADEAHHIDKAAFEVPFVCGATNLGEALRRIGEGAAMIRSKGEAGNGDILGGGGPHGLIGGGSCLPGPPADAALMMQLGAEGVFVGSGIFKSQDPRTRAEAIVEATTHHADPERVARA